MNNFKNIPFQSFIKYQVANALLSKFPRYTIDMSDKEDPILILGRSIFSIIPVASACEISRTVHVFGKDHPSELEFPKLDYIVNALSLPRHFQASNMKDKRRSGPTECFRFCYQLTAVICANANGNMFFAHNQGGYTWIWFVLNAAKNESARALLSEVQVTNLSRDIAEKWYCENEFSLVPGFKSLSKSGNSFVS